MSIWKITLIVVCSVVLVLLIANGIRIFSLLRKTQNLETLKPYEQRPSHPNQKIIFVGDSTAVGTGSNNNTESTAGRMGAIYPEAEILNFGVNGQKIEELNSEISKNNFPKSDLLIIQIGANDIVQFTSLKKVSKELDILLTRAKEVAPKIVILHGGNVGNAPLFPSYFNFHFGFIWDKRTRDFRDLYIRKAAEYDVVYVELYQDREHDIFLTNSNKYYAADMFHPSGEGYAIWFGKTVEAIKNKYSNT